MRAQRHENGKPARSSGLRELLSRMASSITALRLQALLVLLLLVRVAFLGALPILYQWIVFATHALVFPLAMWGSDRRATLFLFLSFMAKVLLALAPAAMLIKCAPRWRIATCVFIVAVLAASVSFVRACPSPAYWLALVLLSALGALLVRYRFLRWALVLPLIVLVVIPASQHGSGRRQGSALAARCAANDGERPVGVDAAMFIDRYYGIHFFPPDWVLLTGETPEDGRFMDIPHGGTGSWWLHKGADGRLSLAGPSHVNGNIWNSCLLGDDRWIVRSGYLHRVRPPGSDGRETVQRFPFEMIGFDAPDTACDPRSGAVFISDLLDGRLIEMSPRTGGKPQRRADSVSVRGGVMDIRASDGRLVMLDFQDLIVYAPEEGRVLQRTAAAAVSSSLSLCQADGSVAVADMGGRVRVFATNAEGGYDFAWGLNLFAPRAAEFSPDCRFLGVTSADDRHVWIVDRESRQVVRTFRIGPAIRGAAFIGTRELAVADACTVTVLRF